jgi:hypothetical protein
VPYFLREEKTYSGDFGATRVRALVPCGAWVGFVFLGTAEAVPFPESRTVPLDLFCGGRKLSVDGDVSA